MAKIFIDGSVGTTGIQIHSRLSAMPDLELLILPEETRKVPEERKKMLDMADIAFLCLPDAAAKEAISLIEDPDTAVIDTSTAHRTLPGWAYGFPELTGMKEKIKNSKRIANPGCHASGFVALVAPLREADLISEDAQLSCFSLTGYSGGGKKMIAEYEAETRPALYEAPRMYGISQTHKHLPEMVKVCSLAAAPAFCPIVAPFYSGMEVTVPLFSSDKGLKKAIEEVYAAYYQGPVIKYCPSADENGYLSAAAYSGYDDMEISVSGNEDRILLTARFDNLGKGASGAAIQNMNILLGRDETAGLKIH